MKGYLLDTNVVSELRKGSRADSNLLAWWQAVDEEELFLSVLVLGELRSGVERIRRRDPAQAQALERWLVDLEDTYADRIFPITAAIADRWGRLSAGDPLSVVDSLMAATAIQNNLTLVTRNTEDVRRTGVNFLNPFENVRT
ncbi:MAG TPA: type II toxin-antitoxin system VapC family toxin [Verrucomicrobiae bacterium]